MRKLLQVIALGLIVGCTSVSQAPPTSTFIVFFDRSSAVLSADGEAEIARAAAAIRSTHPRLVLIAGDPETTTRNGFDPKLGDPRFNAVEGALIADGVDQRILARAGLTDLEIKALPADDRRVEIRLFKN